MRLVPLLVLALPLLAACGDPRSDAANELLRLQGQVAAHAATHGRLPSSFDADQPSSAGNLPFRVENGVAVRVQSVTDQQYLALATKRSWRCWMTGTREQSSVPDCAPTSGSAAGTDTARAPSLRLEPADSARRD